MDSPKTEQTSSHQTEIRQLKNRSNILLQQHNAYERKARTRRLCTRAGYIESILPDTVKLTEEQYRNLINRTLLTGQGREILAAIIAATPDGADGSKTGATAGIGG